MVDKADQILDQSFLLGVHVLKLSSENHFVTFLVRVWCMNLSSYIFHCFEREHELIELLVFLVCDSHWYDSDFNLYYCFYAVS